MTKQQFKVGDKVTLKETTITATTGRCNKEATRSDENKKGVMIWEHDEGRTDFVAVHIATNGRGWERKSTPIILRDGPKKLKAEIVHIFEDQRGRPDVAIIRFKTRVARLRTLSYTARPYVRKSDGDSAPQVAWKDKGDYEFFFGGNYGVFNNLKKGKSKWLSNYPFGKDVDGYVWTQVALKDLEVSK